METRQITIDVTKQLHSAEGPMTLQVQTEILAGQITSLMGPSGAGKTTLLRMLAGLTSPDSGIIRFGDTVWFDAKRKINIPSRYRRIGFMFQDYALFPNMTVRENLEYALGRNESSEIIEELLTSIEIGTLQHQKPAALSGGQQQRVALARALVRTPNIVLLDEPLSALDKEMRKKLQEYLLALHKTLHVTTLFVSHDISEIYTLSDSVMILEKGTIIKRGTPEELFYSRRENGNMQISGEVLSLEPEGKATILVGDSILTVSIPKEESHALNVGGKVSISGTSLTITTVAPK